MFDQREEGVAHTVNKLAHDIDGAALRLAAVTDNFSTEFESLDGVRQFAALNAATSLNDGALWLRALGYDGVAEVVTDVHLQATIYAQGVLGYLNKLYEETPEIEAAKRVVKEMLAKREAA